MLDAGAVIGIVIGVSFVILVPCCCFCWQDGFSEGVEWARATDESVGQSVGQSQESL